MALQHEAVVLEVDHRPGESAHLDRASPRVAQGEEHATEDRARAAKQRLKLLLGRKALATVRLLQMQLGPRVPGRDQLHVDDPLPELLDDRQAVVGGLLHDGTGLAALDVGAVLVGVVELLGLECVQAAVLGHARTELHRQLGEAELFPLVHLLAHRADPRLQVERDQLGQREALEEAAPRFVTLDPQLVERFFGCGQTLLLAAQRVTLATHLGDEPALVEERFRATWHGCSFPENGEVLGEASDPVFGPGIGVSVAKHRVGSQFDCSRTGLGVEKWQGRDRGPCSTRRHPIQSLVGIQEPSWFYVLFPDPVAPRGRGVGWTGLAPTSSPISRHSPNRRASDSGGKGAAVIAKSIELRCADAVCHSN